MNTKDLKYFCTVYETQSLNTAAKKLYISPQGLGKTIKKLEEEMGVELFLRTSSGLTPTESGRVFYERALELLGRYQTIVREVKDADVERKQFRMGFATGVLRAIPLKTMAQFMDSYPAVASKWYELENQEVLSGVKETKLEYGFVIGNPRDAALNVTLIRQQPIVVFVYEGHPLYSRPSLSLGDLLTEPILTMNEKYHIYEKVLKRWQDAGVTPDIRAKAMEGDTLVRLASQKIGLGISPMFYDTLPDNIRAVPCSDAGTWDIYGIYRKDTAERELLEQVNEYFAVNLKL